MVYSLYIPSTYWIPPVWCIHYTYPALTGGVHVSEWNSLFNGQLDGMESGIDALDPMTGIQNSTGFHGDQMGVGSGCHMGATTTDS